MICNLDIKVAQREGKSYLKDAYVTQPFRIVPVGQYRKDNAAYLMMMSSSPGLLDGDDHRIQIDIDLKAKLQLQSQAYQRLFKMKNASHQTLTVKMAEGSCFSYVPHPIVPQESSTFYSRNEIYMEKGCQLLMSEIITCGRKLSGEIFKYNHFQNLIEVYHEGRLLLKDNVLLQPEIMPLQELGLFEGYTHQGTLLYLNTKGISVKELIEEFYEMYHEQSDMEFGISELQKDGFIIRLLGKGGEQLYNIFKNIQGILWDKYFIS